MKAATPWWVCWVQCQRAKTLHIQSLHCFRTVPHAQVCSITARAAALLESRDPTPPSANRTKRSTSRCETKYSVEQRLRTCINRSTTELRDRTSLKIRECVIAPCCRVWRCLRSCFVGVKSRAPRHARQAQVCGKLPVHAVRHLRIHVLLRRARSERSLCTMRLNCVRWLPCTEFAAVSSAACARRTSAIVGWEPYIVLHVLYIGLLLPADTLSASAEHTQGRTW